MNALYYRLGLKAKLSLLAALALCALLIPADTLWNEAAANLDQAHQEISGIAPMQSAVRSVAAVRAYRAANVLALLGAAPRGAVDEARAKVDQALADLSHSASESGLPGLVDAVAARQKRFSEFASLTAAKGTTAAAKTSRAMMAQRSCAIGKIC